eukprot:TRINITY_DN32349_c0_g1_i1.p2 TRINITY_DN32349_c0_g1~~TRINITY_DN32349_c0_g1_i1.p2  ORF type:complete len:225 (-),score=62.08 TRINITY_DN32349_c0_g1_i1:74-748(-)
MTPFPFGLILSLSLFCISTSKFLHFPITTGRSDTLFIPSTVIRPTGRPGLPTLEDDQSEAAQALLQFIGSTLVDRGSLNPRKRAKEAALMAASNPELMMQSEVSMGEYSEQSDQTGRLRSIGRDQTGNLRPPDRISKDTSKQRTLRTRPRVRMAQISDIDKTRTRNRVTTKPPPPKSRFTILRSSAGAEGILVSSRKSILPREGGTKKKITLHEDSLRRNPSQT